VPACSWAARNDIFADVMAEIDAEIARARIFASAAEAPDDDDPAERTRLLGVTDELTELDAERTATNSE
jgi:hypothetical protein